MTGALYLPAAALAHIPADALAQVLKAFADAGGGLPNPADPSAGLALPAAALTHIPADALAKVMEALAGAGSADGQDTVDAGVASDSSLPGEAVSHLPQPALDHLPDNVQLGGGTSDWTLPDAALTHMSTTAHASAESWLFG